MLSRDTGANRNAATALHHQLRLVTRNEKDFNHPNLEAINPWPTA